MRKPKPPTPGSVSATLRYAGFHAIGDGAEGYTAIQHAVGNPAAGIRVTFQAHSEDWANAEVLERDAATEVDALAKMAATLRHKGWQVDELLGYLIVRGQLEASHA